MQRPLAVHKALQRDVAGKRLCREGLQKMQRPLAVHKALQRDVARKKMSTGTETWGK